MAEHKPLLPAAKLDPDTDAPQEGTVLTSYLGLMSTMAGACILTLPSTISAAHVWPSLLILMSTAALAFVGCVCIAIACEGNGAHSYEMLAKRLHSPIQLWIVRCLTMLLLFGAIIMYVVIATDMLEPFIPLSRVVLGGLFAAICLPLCLPDTVAALKYTNSVVIACVLYIVIILTWQASTKNWPTEPTTPVTFRGIAYTVPIQALSFCMHLNVPQVYGELKEKKSITTVFIYVLGSGVALYAIAAIAGYVCFNGSPPSDILTGFSTDNTAINGVRIALGLCMICKTPITYQPLRDVMETMAEGLPKMPFRIASTSIFLAASWILAVTAHDLSYVMDWVGATAGILLSFCFPGLFLWEVLSQENNHLHHTYTSEQVRKYRALAVFMMVAGVSLSIISIVKMICPLHEISAAYSPVNETTPLVTKGKLERGTFFTTYVALLCSMVGSAILTLPSTIAAVHPISWLILLVGAGMLGLASLTCLQIAADITGEYSYEGLCSHSLGRWTAAIVRSLTLLSLFGGAVLYVIIFTDMLTPLFLWPRPLLSVTFGMAAYPICLPTTIFAMRFSNSAVVICAGFITILLVYQTKSKTWPATDLTQLPSLRGLAYAIPIHTLSFSCPFNFLRSYSELQDKEQIGRVSLWLIVSGWCIYFVTSVAGFWCFNGHPPPDILTGFTSLDDWDILGIRIALALCMLLKVPMLFQPFRETIELTWPTGTNSAMFRAFLAGAFIASAVVVAVTVDNISYVMGVIGSIAGIGLSLIVPGYFSWCATSTALWLPYRRWYQIIALITTLSGLLLLGCTVIPFNMIDAFGRR